MTLFIGEQFSCNRGRLRLTDYSQTLLVSPVPCLRRRSTGSACTGRGLSSCKREREPSVGWNCCSCSIFSVFVGVFVFVCKQARSHLLPFPLHLPPLFGAAGRNRSRVRLLVEPSKGQLRSTAPISDLRDRRVRWERFFLFVLFCFSTKVGFISTMNKTKLSVSHKGS